MKRKKDSRRLNSTFFTIRDAVHPIVKRVQIDSAHRHTRGADIEQAAKETLSRRLQAENDDRIQLHHQAVNTKTPRHKGTQRHFGIRIPDFGFGDQFVPGVPLNPKSAIRNPKCLCVFVLVGIFSELHPLDLAVDQQLRFGPPLDFVQADAGTKFFQYQPMLGNFNDA